MSNTENEIRARVDAFVAELTDLVRQAALESLSEALQGGMRTTSRARPRARAASPGGRGGKRTPEEIQVQADQILTYVNANPGLGIEAIARDLGTTSKDLMLPVRKLLAEKALTRKGQKRATKYFPAGRRKRA